MSKSPTDVVASYFEAMRGGKAKLQELLAQFADDATYIEPFSGQTRTHEGLQAITTCLTQSLDNRPPDMTLEVDRVDVDDDVVRSQWTCASPAFPGPMQGEDTCTVRQGKIQRLEVVFK